MKLVEINLHPDRKTLFQFGFVALGAFGLLGGAVLWKRSVFGIELGGAAETVAYALWAVGGISALLSLVAPGLNRFLFVGLGLVTFPIGFVLSYVLLGLIFYGVITPLGILFRLLGHDPLERTFDRERSSYWVEHQEPERAEDYFRQY